MAKLSDAFRETLTPDEQVAHDAADDDAAIAALSEQFAEAEAAEAEAAEAAEAEATSDTEEADATDDDTNAAADDDAGDDTESDDGDDSATADPGADDDEDEDKAAATAPQEEMPDMEAAQQALEAAKKERAEVQARYQDGDLSDEDYEKALDEVNDKIADARADLKTGERIQQRQQDEWMAAGRAYKEKYPDLFKPGMVQALDQAVAALTQIPSVASLPHSELLARAHRKMIAESEYTGLDVPPIKGRPPKRKVPKGDESLGKPPKTLAKAPASDVASGSDGNRYAALAKLGPLELEAELMKMAPEERDRFGSMNLE